jgi:hypothetical protein
MPLIAALLYDCPEVHKYKVSPNGVNYSWLIPQPNGKILLIYIRPIFYVAEWGLFNPLFRWLMHRGLKKQGYNKIFEPVNRVELVKRLLK